jgi:hypothetical protein
LPTNAAPGALSGGWPFTEAVVDVVLFLYREDYYDAPLSRRWLSIGRRDPSVSTARLSCEIATSGTFSSLASDLRPRAISLSSWVRFSPWQS